MPPYSPAATSYAVAFAAETLKAAALATAPPGSPNALFAPACFKGPTTRAPTFWGVRVAAAAAGGAGSAGGAGGNASAAPVRSLRDAVDAWFFLGAAGGLTVADSCTGFACGPACRANGGHARARPTPAQAAAAAARQAREAQAAAAARARHGTAARVVGALVLIGAVTVAFGHLALRLLPERPERWSADARRAAAALAAAEEEGVPLRRLAPAAADSVQSGNPTTGAARYGGF
jgi:hypothetical protein